MTSTESIVFRKEQQEAIDFTVATLQRSRKVLWNAKMRFGKTLCALEVAHRLGYKRTLILTHRPAVRQEWFESIQKLKFDSWNYGSKANGNKTEGEHGKQGFTFEELETGTAKNPDSHYVYFASMQDLRGSKRVNKQKGINKNDNIFNAKWDLLIIDEAHEGTVTRLGNEVISELQSAVRYVRSTSRAHHIAYRKTSIRLTCTIGIIVWSKRRKRIGQRRTATARTLMSLWRV